MESSAVESGMERLTDVLLRHRRGVIAGWVVLCLVGAFFAAGLPGRIVSGGEAPDSSQSEVVARGLADSPLPSLFLTVRVPEGTSTAVQEEVTAAVAAAAGRVDGVTHVRPRPLAPPQRPEGERVTVLDVSTSGGTDGAIEVARDLKTTVPDTVADAVAVEVAVEVGGFGAYRAELTTESQQDLARAERFGIPIVLVVLLLTFGSLWAAGMPLAIALSALVMGLGSVGALAYVLPMSDFVTNAATMIGLALGVDYALFLVQRVRELAQDRPVDAAVREAMRTTGTAVLWSGVTVLLAEATLFLVDSRSIRSAAAGMVLVTLFAVLTSLVVAPVLISMLGERITRVRRRARSSAVGSRWERWARHVTRRAPVYLVAAVLVMVGLALPSAGLADKVNISGTSTLPAASSVRAAYEDAALRYGGPALSPALVLVPADAAAEVPDVVAAATGDRAVATAQPLPLPDGSTAVVVTGRFDPYSADAREMVQRLRAHPAVQGSGAAVGGETALSMDATDAMFSGLPKVGLALLVVVGILLLAALRSVFLPLKAVVLVVVSLGASLGALVLLATTPLGATLIGADGPHDIHPIVPITIVAITVALSTDYEVLLISRIAEVYRRTGDNRGAIVEGLRHTGSVINSAAVIMAAVFAGFALADLPPLKQLGVGLAIAVVLDATLVRGVLVPAAMAIMGRGNWWWPSRRSPVAQPASPPQLPEPGREVASAVAGS
jgi:uncharacterized membrane protein YdfJ with MMPL/SSD domain